MRKPISKWIKIITVVLVVTAVLAFAFWYGGDAPGLRGWHAATGTPAITPEITAAVSETPLQTPVAEAEIAIPENTVTTETLPHLQATVTPTAPLQPTETPETEEADIVWSESQGMVIDGHTGTDQYNTDPVPEGKPAPVEPENAVVTDTAQTCTLSISCATILPNMDWLDEEKWTLVPEDGWLLAPVEVTFYEGESVFNVLQRTCKQNGIQMEFSITPMYNSAYIEGIGNLYEVDVGELSGWMYKVNDWFPNYGCSRYQLQPDDVVCWVYTCDMGNDVGGQYVVGG